MANMVLILFDEAQHAALWDEFVVNSSWNGTFLHTRKYLSYHGDRFVDRSFMIFDKKGKVIAVFPAAESLSDPNAVVSHPGITYGGLVVGERCRRERCVKVLRKLMHCYANAGYRRLLYKAVPGIFHKKLVQDDLYALFRVGARLMRSDLSSAVYLESRGKRTKGRKY